MNLAILRSRRDLSCRGVYINAKFAINSHCSYKKNLGVDLLVLFRLLRREQNREESN